MRFADFLNGIRFDLVGPVQALDADERFTLVREDRSRATLFQLPNAPYDVANAWLGPSTPMVRRALRPHCEMPRMGSFAGGAILNQGVRRMGPGEAYVNVGTWHGYSLLCGMAGNPDRRCIGIDNFTFARAPRQTFEATFDRYRGPAHSFFDGDYRDYFANHHEGPIGLYFYDGNHDYDDQVGGLQIAEPFFADGCVIVVDDTNWDEPYKGTYDFIAQSDRDYDVLLDVRTPNRFHPTFWNGLIVLQAKPSSRATRADGVGGGRAASEPLPPKPIDFEGRDTLVSVVVYNDQAEVGALANTIEAMLAQTWTRVEVLVTDSSGDAAVADAIESFGDRVVAVTAPDGRGPRAALEASHGSLVAFVDPAAVVEPFSIEAGLAFPELCHFAQGGQRHKRMGRALAAGADISDAIPADTTFAMAGSPLDLPRGLDPQRAIPILGKREQALDEDAAIARIEQLARDRGATHAVFLWSMFDWLDDRPRLVQHLDGDGRRVRDNDNVRIFTLDRRRRA